MRALAGQAARHGGRLAHALVQLALGLVILLTISAGLLAWRLDQGPLDLPWLARWITDAANGAQSAVRVEVGRAALTWEGFSAGVDRPLDIRLSDVSAHARGGATVARLRHAALSFAVTPLLIGRIEPLAIALDGLELRAERQPDGSLDGDLAGMMPDSNAAGMPSSPREILMQMAQPPHEHGSGIGRLRWTALRHLQLRDVALHVADHAMGVTWDVPFLIADLRRDARGALSGEARTELRAGDRAARLALKAGVAPGAAGTELNAEVSGINPADWSSLVPQLESARALDAVVALTGMVQLDAELRPDKMRVSAEIGPGTIRVAQGRAPLRGASVSLEGTAEDAELVLSRLELAAGPERPVTTVRGRATLSRQAVGGMAINASIDLDRVTFEDLPALWPEGVGGRGTRPWIVKNLTSGTMRNGHVELALTTTSDYSNVKVSKVTGGIQGEEITVHWLRPVPPIEHAAGRLSFLTPDSIGVDILSGRQGTMAITAGRVVFTGFNDKDQFAEINGNVAGPLAELVALLKHPRIKLLDRRPVALRDPSGAFSGQITLTGLPLRDDIDFDQLNIRTQVRLSNAHLGGLAAGRDLSRGNVEITADPDKLTVNGSADIGGVPAQLQVGMDFRSGGPDQALQRVDVSGTVTDRQIAQLGFDPGAFARGSAALRATVIDRRDGTGEIAINADLQAAELQVSRAHVRKPAGTPATATARLLLRRGTLVSADELTLEAPGISVAGTAGLLDGKLDIVRIHRARIGRTDAAATVRPPRMPGDGWIVTVSGATLDASGEFGDKTRPPRGETSRDRGPPWHVEARLDRLLLADSRAVTGITAIVDHDGRVVRHATLAGRTAPGAGFHANIVPDGSRRMLHATADDAGALLAALGVAKDIQGGRLDTDGVFEDTEPGSPLVGTAELEDFRVRDAPALGRVLKAMTLYGLVDLVQGPGLGFSRAVAPFRYADGMIDLGEARAYSPSLGLTATGRMDLNRQTTEIKGTIVPAYFFNTLLGELPLIGRLFSPERGGGVFAATYTVRGPVDDPSVSVNPLAALTPGFLRGLFGMFDQEARKP